MNNLTIRALTGAVYVALTLGAAWMGPFATFLLFLPVALLGAFEMHRLYWPSNDGPPLPWSLTLAGVCYVGLGVPALTTSIGLGHGGAVVLGLLLLAIWRMLLRGAGDPAHQLGGLLTLVLLVAAPFAILPHLVAHEPWAMVGFMFMLWTNDTGAYLVGRALGRTKLLPSVSPNKTIEGFVGGVLLTLVVAALLSQWHRSMELSDWLACGAIVATTSTLGDLLESSFKRARGVKDSGNILPGHGGILDRFDGFLLALPAMTAYLFLARLGR